MNRREFIALLGGPVAAVWSGAAPGQQPAMSVIGFLNSVSPGPSAPFLAAFHEGLANRGFVENQNVLVEYRWAHGDYERLSELASDLVRRKVNVIAATGGGPSALAAKSAT